MIVNCLSNERFGEPLSVVRTQIVYELFASKLKLTPDFRSPLEIEKEPLSGNGPPPQPEPWRLKLCVWPVVRGVFPSNSRNLDQCFAVLRLKILRCDFPLFEPLFQVEASALRFKGFGDGGVYRTDGCDPLPVAVLLLLLCLAVPFGLSQSSGMARRVQSLVAPRFSRHSRPAPDIESVLPVPGETSP